MTHNVLVVGFGGRPFNFPVSTDVETGTLRDWIDQKLGSGFDYHLTRGGAPLRETDTIPCHKEWGTTLIIAHPTLLGGKGGFGALIRAVGSRSKRGGNKEACRDLSGRRLRDVNAQKKATKWLEDEPERKRKRREEKRKRLLAKKDPPKHFFDDQAYMEQLRSNEEGMDSALKQGLEASGLKRKQPASEATAGPSTAKKPKFWVGGEEDDLSSDDTSDMDSDSDTPPTDNKLCQSGAGSSKMDPALNSAGSSDEGVQSKPSDEEDVGSVAKAGGGCSDGGNGGTVEGDKAATATLETPPGGGETEVERGGSEGCDTAGEAVNGKEEVLEKVESQDKEVIENESKKEVSPQNPEDDGPLDLNNYGSVEELESAGAGRLKSVLQSLGLKCGGTLQERAQRLFSTKGKSLEELDPSLFAKAGKSRKRKNKTQQ